MSTKSVVFGNNVIGVVPSSGPIRLWDCGVTWADIEPVQNEFHWDKLDALVSAAGNRSILLVLGHPALWAALKGGHAQQAEWLAPGANRPPANTAIWKNYIHAVVSRYRNTISAYQIWNEPADPRFYCGRFDTLALYTKIAYDTIKGIDRNLKVISPPLQPRRQAGWRSKGKEIMEELKNYGYPFDIWAAHIYPQIGEGVKEWVRDAHIVLGSITRDKPLWITESNFNLGGPGNPYFLNKQKQMLDTVRLRCYALGIERVYWYGYHHSDPTLFALSAT